MKNKIGFCNLTWNPVWGCKNNCRYCYARTFAKRFGSVMAMDEYFSHYWGNKRIAKGINKAEVERMSESLREFKPTFLYGQYFKKFPKKPQRIFIGSMSEIYYWEKEWMEKVLYRVKEYPQHTFIFLSKHPEVYARWSFPSNCWLGITITRNAKDGEPDRWDIWQFKGDNINNLKFYCFEPLLEAMKLQYYHHLEGIGWVIIGAETGSREGKVIPKLEWLIDIVEQCRMKKIPVYLKDSILTTFPELVNEYPTFHKFPGWYENWKGIE